MIKIHVIIQFNYVVRLLSMKQSTCIIPILVDYHEDVASADLWTFLVSSTVLFIKEVYSKFYYLETVKKIYLNLFYITVNNIN